MTDDPSQEAVEAAAEALFDRSSSSSPLPRFDQAPGNAQTACRNAATQALQAAAPIIREAERERIQEVLRRQLIEDRVARSIQESEGSLPLGRARVALDTALKAISEEGGDGGYRYEIRHRYAEHPEARVFCDEKLIAQKKASSIRRLRRWSRRFIRQAEKHGDIVPAPGYKREEPDA